MRIATFIREISLSRIISTPARCQDNRSSMIRTTALQILRTNAQARLVKAIVNNVGSTLLMTRTVGE